MGDVFITGDMHGWNDYYPKLSHYNFPDDKMTRDDYLIICGDFGGIWSMDENDPDELELLRLLSGKKYTILFCDGNHENFQRLYKFPVIDWNGGKVHKIADNIYHLMRGEIYDINGKTYFVMGGAASTDKEFRIEGVSWWKEEIPNKKERKYAEKNLRAHNKKVDYIITHTAPSNVIRIMGREYRIDEYTNWLQKIADSVVFDKWYFGHFHTDAVVDNEFQALYDNILWQF